MDRIMNIYEKIRRNNKLLTAVVSTLGVCLLGVIVLFVCMPDIQAASVDEVEWAASDEGVYELSALPDGNGSTVKSATISASNGGSITIDGSGFTKENVSIVINYTGNIGTNSDPARVNVYLKNVTINQSLDYAAIRFATNGTPVDYVVTVDGSNSITSSCAGAKTPLIAVESTTYNLYKLKNNANGKAAADFVEETDMSKQVGMILCGESADDTLKLVNAAGSYGALIGTGETNSFAKESQVELQKYLDTLNNSAMGEQILIGDSGVIADLKEIYGYTPLQQGVYYPEYKIKSTEGTSAGKITIGGDNSTGSKPLSLILNNAGCGAAVGGGGSAGDSQSKNKGANAGKITINAGTITYKTTGSKAPVFGSGHLAGAANIESTYGKTNGVEINGGSLFFNGYENKFGKEFAVNKFGDRLYEIKAFNEYILYLEQKNDGDTLKLDFEYDPTLMLNVDLDEYTVSKVRDEAGVKMADVDITLSSSVIYSYDGRGHGNSMFYFYLPAVQTTTLTIEDEFGLGYSKFKVKDSNGKDVEPISTDDTSLDSRKFVLVRDKIYYIYATELPLGLNIKNVALSTGKDAAFNSANGYQVDTTTSEIVANVTYSGEIDVVYNDGLLADDRANHDVAMPTKDYDYGTESFSLPDLGIIYKERSVGGQVVDIIFDKWVYTDAEGNELGNITHIVKSKSVDGNQRKYSDIMQPDGKIYLKAKWKIKVDFVIGDDATYAGALPVVEAEYAYGTDNMVSFKLPSGTPVKKAFEFQGWTLDEGEELYTYNASSGSKNNMEVSSLTSHVFYANYKRTEFSVYIDASALDEKYADLACMDFGGADMLVRNSDGSLATVVVDGRTYYYTNSAIRDTVVRVVIKTKHGYRMENTSIKVTGSASSDVATDSATGECTADVLIESQHIYVTTNATFKPVEYEITFRDGKEPNEVLWGGTKFTFDIEDIMANRTIGDIIREGLGDESMSDETIAAYINAIDKNTRFTDFYGFTLPLYADALPMDKTIASIYAENPKLAYGDMVFTAQWVEYDKYAINMNLFERVFEEDGLYRDIATEDLVAVLYYYADGATKAPVYTEVVVDPETGDEQTVAYAKAGDKIEIALYRANNNGRPIGEPIVEGIQFEALYYEYESKLNESVRADIKDGTAAFTVKDDVKDETTIQVYMYVSLKKYNIIYWDLRGFDNSLNPSTYTIFDEIEFVPIADGVDWLLVCPDTDDTNNDDITTEVIYRIDEYGKLVTDGAASDRDYISNLVLKPDWSQYEEDSYSVSISLGENAYGTVKVLYPQNGEEFFANEVVILSVVPNPGYKLVDNSLVYKKESATVYSRVRTTFLNRKELNEFVIPALEEANGTYIFTMPSSDVVISALFELCQYNIIYSDVSEDVVNTNPDSYNINSIIELTDLVREGYKFLGWYDAEDNLVTRIVDRTGDLVLTPKFELLEDAIPTDPEKPEGSEDGDKEKPEDNKPGSDDADDNGEGSDDAGDSGNKPEGDKPDSDNNGTNNGGTDADKNNGAGNSGSVNNSVTITGRPSNVVSRPMEGNNGTVIKPSTNNSQNGTLGNTGSNIQSGIHNGVQTGDQTNVPKLALICTAAVLILLIFAFKRPNDKDEEE